MCGPSWIDKNMWHSRAAGTDTRQHGRHRMVWMTGAGILAPYLMGFILEKPHSFNMAYYVFSGRAFMAGRIAVNPSIFRR